jgi:hypothetical protein
MQAGYLEAEAARLNMASKEGLRMGPNTIVSDFTPYGKAIPPGALQPPPQMTKEELVDKYTSINQQAVQAGRDAVAFAMTREGLGAAGRFLHLQMRPVQSCAVTRALWLPFILPCDACDCPDMTFAVWGCWNGRMISAAPPGTIHSKFNKFGQSVPEGALKMADRTPPPDMYHLRHIIIRTGIQN